MASFDIDRWLPDRTLVEPKRGPKVSLPTFENVKPKPASTVSSGLNDAALGAIEAGNSGIDQQRGHYK
jgi:hypothetical protein